MRRSSFALCLMFMVQLAGLSACTLEPIQEPLVVKQDIPTVGPIAFASTSAIGTLPYLAEVMAQPTVKRVDYRLEGVHLGSVTVGAKFTIELDGLDPGSYELQATAYTGSGQAIGEARQTLYVLANAAMEIHVPLTESPGLFLLKTHTAGPIVRVKYFVDGKHVGESTATTNFFAITVPIAQAGTHKVTAEGFDEHGYRLTTATKKFTLMENAAGTLTPPTQLDSFGFLSPTGQSTSPLTFSVNAPTATSRVDYLLTGSQHLGTSSDATSDFAVFSTDLKPGKWPITARAMNQDGTVIAEVTELVTIIELEEPTSAAPSESESLVKGVIEEPNTTVSFLLPANGKALQGATTPLQVETEGPITTVQYFSGNTLIAASSSVESGFLATYTFWTPGLRLIEAKALNANLELVAISKLLLMVGEADEELDPPAQAPPSDEPVAPNNTPTCTPGELVDCNGSCAKAEWVADGYCDDGNNYPSNFLCPELGMDGADCGK